MANPPDGVGWPGRDGLDISMSKYNRNLEETNRNLEETRLEISELSSTVKVWPLMGISAWRNQHGGAYRLWILAKAIDQEGSGAVTDAELRGAARSLGVHKRSFRRWLAHAGELGLLETLQRRSGKAYRISSHEKGAQALGCSYAGPRYVMVPLKRLFNNKRWKGVLFAAAKTYTSRQKVYETLDKETQQATKAVKTVWSPISREALQKMTGISRSAQWRLEKKSGTRIRKCYATPDIDGSMLDGVRDFWKPHAFPNPHTGKVAWRMPNIHQVPSNYASRGKYGRSKKINRALVRGNGSAGSLKSDVAQSDDIYRVFYDDHKAAEKALKDWEREETGELYAKVPRWKSKYKPRKRPTAVCFDVLPVAREIVF